MVEKIGGNTGGDAVELVCSECGYASAPGDDAERIACPRCAGPMRIAMHPASYYGMQSRMRELEYEAECTRRAAAAGKSRAAILIVAVSVAAIAVALGLILLPSPAREIIAIAAPIAAAIATLLAMKKRGRAR